MAIRELQGCVTGVDLTPEQRRRFNAVNYRLDGSRIKAALALNHGKIILAPRRSGKTISLAEYAYENFHEGAIFFVVNETIANYLKDQFPSDYFKEVIVCWGGGGPKMLYGENKPVFADEIFLLPGMIQKRIISDPRFEGAVGTPSGLTVEEVKKLCILY